MKTQDERIDTLLQGIDQAKNDLRFDIIEDLNILEQQLAVLNKRQYQQLLAQMVDKYTTVEQEVVHAALVAKCKEGDKAALKLFYELHPQTAGENSAGAKIIYDV